MSLVIKFISENPMLFSAAVIVLSGLLFAIILIYKKKYYKYLRVKIKKIYRRKRDILIVENENGKKMLLFGIVNDKFCKEGDLITCTVAGHRIRRINFENGIY